MCVWQVEAASQSFELLQAAHRAVAGRTRTLHGSCERLVGEKARLAEYADALRTKLEYFDELDRMAAAFHQVQGVARGDRKRPLNEAQIPLVRAARVHVSTGYNRGEGHRRPSRNGLVRDLPPSEIPHVTIRNHLAIAVQVKSRTHVPQKPLNRLWQALFSGTQDLETPLLIA